MKRRMKKITALLLSSVMLASVLSGCGGQEKETAKTESNAESASASSEGQSTQPANEDGGDGAETEITFWCKDSLETGPQSTTIANAIAERTGVRLNVVNGDAQKFKVLLAGGDLPGIVNSNYGDLGVDANALLESGQLIPLDELIEEHAPNLKERFADKDYPVYLLDDAGELNGRKWRVCVRAYSEKLAVISEKIFEGSGSAPVSFLGYLPVKKEQVKGGPALFTTEVFADGEKAGGTFYWANYQQKTGSLLALPQTKLEYSVRERDGQKQIRICNTGKHPAAGVTVECPLRDTSFSVSDSMFWLNPGEERLLTATDTEGLRIKAWNVPAAKEAFEEAFEAARQGKNLKNIFVFD